MRILPYHHYCRFLKANNAFSTLKKFWYCILFSSLQFRTTCSFVHSLNLCIILVFVCNVNIIHASMDKKAPQAFFFLHYKLDAITIYLELVIIII